MPDFIDVFVDLRIFNDLPAKTDAAHDRPAYLRLKGLSQYGVGGAAHIGNLNIIGARTTDKHNGRKRN